jgi:hypothetical protein
VLLPFPSLVKSQTLGLPPPVTCASSLGLRWIDRIDADAQLHQPSQACVTQRAQPGAYRCFTQGSSLRMAKPLRELLEPGRPGRSPNQHGQGKSYTCERCLSTWPGVPDRAIDTEICTIEESVEELLLSACGVCHLLGTVMLEHRKTNSALTKPTLDWGSITRWNPYVSFDYPGGGGPKDSLFKPGTLPFISVHHASPDIERLTSSRMSPHLDRKYPVHVDFDQIKR